MRKQTARRTKLYGEQYFRDKMETAARLHVREYEACNAVMDAAIDCFGVDVALAFIGCDPGDALSLWEGPYRLYKRRLDDGYESLFTAEDRLTCPFPCFKKSVDDHASQIQSFHKVITDSIGMLRIETDVGVDVMQEPGRELRMYLVPRPWREGCTEFVWLYFAFHSFVSRLHRFRICQAPDCRKVFYTSSRSHEQAFCSPQCQNRIYKRGRREKAEGE